MRKRNAGLWVGIVVFGFALSIFYQSFAFPYANKIGPGPGPGFFPIWLSGILLILSVLYVVNSLKRGGGEGSFETKSKAFKNVLMFIGSMMFFLLSVSYLGFILSGAIFLFMLLYKNYKWYSSIPISLGVSLFLFWLFHFVLNVTLPVSALGW